MSNGTSLHRWQGRNLLSRFGINFVKWQIKNSFVWHFKNKTSRNFQFGLISGWSSESWTEIPQLFFSLLFCLVAQLHPQPISLRRSKLLKAKRRRGAHQWFVRFSHGQFSSRSWFVLFYRSNCCSGSGVPVSKVRVSKVRARKKILTLRNVVESQFFEKAKVRLTCNFQLGQGTRSFRNSTAEGWRWRWVRKIFSLGPTMT
jgi:hypothetical protein